MHEITPAHETVFMLTSRIEQLQDEVRRLTHAIKENAYITQDNKRIMYGWARKALGEEINDSVYQPAPQVVYFEAW